MDEKKHIHLSGICGTAMASLAGMLQLKRALCNWVGYGGIPADVGFSARPGIPIADPFSEKNLDPAPDLVIVGNALSRGNPEVEYVLDQRIPFQSMAQITHDEFIWDTSHS